MLLEFTAILHETIKSITARIVGIGECMTSLGFVLISLSANNDKEKNL